MTPTRMTPRYPRSRAIEVAGQPVEVGEKGLAARDHDLGDRRRHEAAPRALEQLRPDQRLELLQRLGDCGLAVIQFRRDETQHAMATDRRQQREMARAQPARQPARQSLGRLIDCHFS